MHIIANEAGTNRLNGMEGSKYTMELDGYRKISRTNITATWVCAVILAGLSFRNYGFSYEFLCTAAVMFGTALFISVLYFVRMHEALKGGIIVTTVGLATLLASVLQGGSDRNFIASFFVLALATLYFDSRIIMGYSVIYICVCAFACLVNPAYIDGTDYETARVLIKLVIYTAVAIVLYAATRQGEGLIRRSTEATRKIIDTSEAARSASEHLFQSVENGNGSMEEMAGNISLISSSAASVKDEMDNMLQSVHGMRETVLNSSAILRENLECTKSLSESYGNVLSGVQSGRRAMNEAGHAIRSAADSVLSADEATGRLLEQMEMVGEILKRIHTIASKTNLLSINASIEAARSGVHGKGFAVVAGEIHTLATDSAAAAANIQQIIDGLISVTSLVSERVTDSASLLKGSLGQIECVDKSLSSLETISGDVESIIQRENRLIGDFQGKYEEVETQLSNVVELLRDSASLVSQIDSSLHEQTAASDALASQLEEIASVSFELKDKMQLA